MPVGIAFPGRALRGAMIRGEGQSVGLWEPADLGASLKHWWNADDVSDGAVATWTDRIGSLAPTQATSGFQPVAAIGTASKRWINFDGTDDYLRATGTGNAPVGADPSDYYLLVEHVGAPSTNRLILNHGGTTPVGNRQIGTSISTSQLRVRAVSANIALADTAQVISNIIAVIDAQTTPTLLTAFANGAPTTPASVAITGLATTTTSTTIGGSNAGTPTSFAQVKLRHAMITTALSEADRQKLQGWLAWDVDAQANLVAGHPYRTVRP